MGFGLATGLVNNIFKVAWYEIKVPGYLYRGYREYMGLYRVSGLGFPKIRDPHNRICSILGSVGVPPILGSYHIASKHVIPCVLGPHGGLNTQCARRLYPKSPSTQ